MAAPTARCSASAFGRATVLAHALLGLLLTVRPAGAHDFLLTPAGAHDFLQTFNITGFEQNLQGALEEGLRCGAEAGPDERAEVAGALLPMWRSLQKNSRGRVPWRMVRYLAHRYFMRRSSLMIRGFEPTRLLSSSDKGVPDVLADQAAPLHLKALLASKHASTYGFSLDDVAGLVLVLRRLLFESQGPLLAGVYRQEGVPQGGAVDRRGLASLLEEYMVHWMMSGDARGIQVLTQRPKLRTQTFPNWPEILTFAEGQARAVGYAREHDSSAERGRRAFRDRQFAFEDVHEAVGSITASFASYWEPQCATMKRTLFQMDPHRTGRVPLADFYSAALESEWQFTESEAYLRELGALDETSEWRGSQVIIPNYVQAAPNCIITARHYWLCCRNECEDLFGEIETAIGAPTASPEKILQVVGNMTAQEALDDDASPALTGVLPEQLRSIAAAHRGQVPLHGRLFAQWLHYTFPHQCPFPHRAGRAAAISPIEFGSGSEASREEMRRHAAAATGAEATLARLAVNISAADVETPPAELLGWMSQWSGEEELLTDDGLELRAPWSDGVYAAAGGMVLLLAATVGAMRLTLKLPEEESRETWLLKMQMV